MWVDNSDIEISPLEASTPKTVGRNVQPGIAEVPVRVSPVIDCRVGSVQTSLQTSDIQSATVSRTSL